MTLHPTAINPGSNPRAPLDCLLDDSDCTESSGDTFQPDLQTNYKQAPGETLWNTQLKAGVQRPSGGTHHETSTDQFAQKGVNMFGVFSYNTTNDSQLTLSTDELKRDRAGPGAIPVREKGLSDSEPIAGIAAGRDPSSAATFMRWMDIALIAGISLGVILIVTLLALAFYRYRSRDEGSYRIDNRNYTYEVCSTRGDIALEGKVMNGGGGVGNGGILKGSSAYKQRNIRSRQKVDAKEWYV